MKKLFVYIQYILPQHLLSVFMRWLAESRTPWFKNFAIRRFIKKYKVDMSFALVENPSLYPTFNDFFTRQLKPELRPIVKHQYDIACPVDGVIAQIGKIKKNQLLQAKQFYFDLETLLGGDETLARDFYDGSYATFYLAPHDYHRIHMPLTGRLEKTIYVPGKLFSVNQLTSSIIPHLYSRNERLITIFSTESGPMAVILVGAIIVGSIQTAWMNQPVSSNKITITTPSHDIYLKTGDELGQFKLGSTVILLYSKDKIKWNPSLNLGNQTHFGQLIGNIII